MFLINRASWVPNARKKGVAIRGGNASMYVMTTVRFVLAVCVAGVLTPAPALAYIDPVAGSIMLQVLIAGILGSLLAFKRVGFAVKNALFQIWRRLTG
ncbi:MAG: hypothetical protein WD802_12620 [Gemmatimonadaceae bacterium]